MTNPSDIAGSNLVARVSTGNRATLMTLATNEYDKFAALLAALDTDDWSAMTDCPNWDVRAMASHVLGMGEMAASKREAIHQLLAARRRGGVFIDALTAVQVHEREDMSPSQIMDRFRLVSPRAARARRQTPRLIRGRPMPVLQQVGDAQESWTIGFLLDTVLTRDVWMHRLDISRATHRVVELTGDHDGVVVHDVVTEWAARHGQPCHLHLNGPAGGTWDFGVAGPLIDMDAVEFCRTVGGRENLPGLMAVQVPF